MPEIWGFGEVYLILPLEVSSGILCNINSFVCQKLFDTTKKCDYNIPDTKEKGFCGPLRPSILQKNRRSYSE